MERRRTGTFLELRSSSESAEAVAQPCWLSQIGAISFLPSSCCRHTILDVIHVPSVPVQALKSILEVGNGMFNLNPDSRERVVEEMQVTAFLSSYV